MFGDKQYNYSKRSKGIQIKHQKFAYKLEKKEVSKISIVINTLKLFF